MDSTQYNPPPLNVLLVDDELNIRKALSACLEADGHRVVSVGSETDAELAIERRSFDLAFVDLFLGKSSGLDLIPKLLGAAPWMKVVVITAFASLDTAIESMKRGATDYLSKPFTPAQVNMVTGKVAQLRVLEQRLATLQDELGQASPEVDLSTQSPAMQRALTLARQAAPSDATVLIRGESGTGKSIVARAIHGWSARAAKPFAVVACPALSAELLESELFGHVRGSFTGAVRDNPGRIVKSEGGTLFLDEIGELPLRVQPKLLRFLQDRRFERVGDQHTRQADVRIIAATNADLALAVARGSFREDLWYRLNVISIELPPLRERCEDIPDLAERLLLHFARQNRKPQLRLSAEAIGALQAYNWPGNVRELRNVLERATILCSGQTIDVGHLLLGAAPPTSAPRLGDPIPIEKMEELHIRGVLSTTRSIERAAEILGMDTVTLWRRRKKYGID
ncbi:MAG TPA: sigma-54 dependent transcriptional regulator [Tepidisphaeraceae bacterium]|nr:sigma-54 dependent transcriptional regulator [Tepidisphaeraceae bacterium]